MYETLLVDNGNGLLDSVEELLRVNTNVNIKRLKELSPEIIQSIQAQVIDLIIIYIDSKGPIKLENLKRVIAEHTNARVIIVSNNGDFAPEAYSMAIFDYLTLPVTEARLNKTLLRVCS